VTHHVTFRASPLVVARIDRLAGARKVSRSAVIKAAILEATVPKYATAIADEQEVLVLLTEAARGGSVSAMKALLAYHHLPQPAAVDPIFAELDELAQRRGDTPA
jgi:predicted transcriptional regulator